MLKDWQYWPIVRPVVRLLSSSKFIALLLAALIADYGLDLSDNVQAMVYAIAAVIYAGTTAVEDAAAKRGTDSS